MRYGLILAVLFGTLSLYADADDDLQAADEKLPAKEYVSVLRKTPLSLTWGKLSGKLNHYRRGQGRVDTSVYLGMLGTPNHLMAQLWVGSNEGYRISQQFGDVKNTLVTPLPWSTDTKIGMYGFTPDDLTFSFFYWDFHKEYSMETKAVHRCRVLEFISPDSERVKAWVVTKYRKPLEVSWFRKNETEPYRTLKVKSFGETDNGLWLVKEIGVEGPGWGTTITFTDRKAGYVKDGVPPDLFAKPGVNTKTDSAPVRK